MFAFCFEDPLGEYLPKELSVDSKPAKNNGFKWLGGMISCCAHEKWGLQMASQLSCLCSGADGVWASLCEEGGAMGHACSSVTFMNLMRVVNKKVLQKYNCTNVRNATKKITQIPTAGEIHVRNKLSMVSRL